MGHNPIRELKFASGGKGNVMDILKMHSMYSTLVTSLELTGLDAVLKEGGRTREMGC